MILQCLMLLVLAGAAASPVVVQGSGMQIITNVQFAPGSARLDKKGIELLEEVAKVMREYPEIKLVEIHGNSDTRECKVDDLRLSQRRADNVRSALIKLGVEPERLVSVAHGGKEPVASNDSKAGRAKNRYVTFRLPPAPDPAP